MILFSKFTVYEQRTFLYFAQIMVLIRHLHFHSLIAMRNMFPERQRQKLMLLVYSRKSTVNMTPRPASQTN